MAGVDQTLEGFGAAVVVLDCVEESWIVAPGIGRADLVYGHQLQRRDLQLAQVSAGVLQFPADVVERRGPRTAVAETRGVNLVEAKVIPWRCLPAVALPGVMIAAHQAGA